MATDNLMPQSSASIIKHFMLRSSTTGQGLTGKVYSDFSGKYNIAGGAEVTLSFSSGAVGDAYSSGKIVPLGLGKYAWHVPNAVFASLGNVSAVLSVTGGIDVHCEWLVVADSRDLATKPVNVTQLGGDTQSLTDLKDFADAGYDPSTNKVQGVVLTDALTTYTGNTPQTGDGYAVISHVTHGNSALKTLIDTLTGYVDTEVAAIKTKTDNLPSDPADASDIASSFSTVNSTLSTIAAYIDTEVAAIKAKTDNLPSDPADASDIAASFSSIASTLSTIAAYIDTEVAAIKAKTDNLPSDPADQSAVEAAITAATSPLATAANLALIPIDGTLTVTLANGVTHGGSTAMLRLGSSTTTPAFYVVNSSSDDNAHAVYFKAGSSTTGGAGLLIDGGSLQTTFIAPAVEGLYAGGDSVAHEGEITAIKAKTDNLPSDPADASDIATSFSSIASTLVTIAAYIDTEVAAIKAKTDNLPSDPADQSAIEAAITSATSVLATAANLATVAGYIDTEIAAIKAKTDLLVTFPTNFSSLEINASGHISRVVLVDTTTTNADLVSAATIATTILTTQMTESYSADGVAPTLAQALFLMQQAFTEFVITGTSISVKKLDGVTEAAAYTMNSSTLPTQRLRTS